MNLNYFPGPAAIADAFIEVLHDRLLTDLAYSVGATALALAIAMVGGGLLGLAVGLLPQMRPHVMGSIDFQRTIPAIALIPTAAIILGPSPTTVVVLATYAASWPVVLSVAEAVRSVHPRLLDSGRTLRLSKSAVIGRVVIPSVIPYWLDAARLAALIALQVSMTAEIILGTTGLGSAMVLYLNGLAPAHMWAYALVSAVVAMTFSEVFRWLANRRPVSELTRTDDRIPWWGLWPIVAILVIWQLLGSTSSLEFPAPSAWLAALADLGEHLWAAMGNTMMIYAAGLLIALVAGVAGGIVLGSSPRVETLSVPVLNLAVAVPVAASIPLLVLLLGFGPVTGITIIALIATWPILLICTSARRRIPTERLDLGRTLNISRRRQLTRIVIPSMLPGIVLGARLGSTLAFVAALLGDILGGGEGLGRLLLEAHSRFDAAAAWGLLAVIGLIGYLASTGVAWLERAVTPVRPPRSSRARLLRYRLPS